LQYLSQFEDWVPEHPLIIEYAKAMDEPHRVYHGWSHIAEMLNHTYEIPPGIIQDPIRLRAAILFHDVVCIPQGKDNEGESALFATKFYRCHTMALISNLIIATAHEFPFKTYGDDRDVICDIDLATLGAEKDRFDLYRFNIAKEYHGFCTPESFDVGTLTFFKKLHDQALRDSIYRTDFFRNRYELLARDNIKRVLAGYGL
jgi:predicted metal-dependent HD superfamily phosphohydrolase